ncbi:MAG: alpha-galactosidase [Chthoniobacterales bacterium]|nr:alpha-galactosidase [Chthoniobacterales bacterium]
MAGREVMKLERKVNGEWRCVAEWESDCEVRKITSEAEEREVFLRLFVPILDIQGYWIPSLRTPEPRVKWVIESQSAGQRDFPFLIFLNSAQQNICAVGLDCLQNDVAICARVNQETCNYEITLRVVMPSEDRSFCVQINRHRKIWTEVLAEWRHFVHVPAPKFPPAAWKPVYCTWYAAHAAVEQDWVERNAEIAAKLGFGTLIVDDGWCFDAMKRVSPQTIDTWYEMIGDWVLSTKKFPDFNTHRARVQALGLKYLLWATPFLIGAKSRFYREFKECCGPICHEGCYTLDPACEAAKKEMIRRLSSLVNDHGLDGLKIDFLDQITPNCDTPRGRETSQFIAELSAAIRECKSDALIEFRESYATVAMLPFGTQFRAGDVPFDFLDNFQRIVKIRVGMGDCIPVHADPAYWHPQESPDNISRHMIAAMAGVPMLSMDLTKISEMERLIIGNWLKFYATHLEHFQAARWQASYQWGITEFLSSTTDGRRIVILNHADAVQRASADFQGELILLNMTPESIECPGAACLDCLGNPTKVLRPGGRAALQISGE